MAVDGIAPTYSELSITSRVWIRSIYRALSLLSHAEACVDGEGRNWSLCVGVDMIQLRDLTAVQQLDYVNQNASAATGRAAPPRRHWCYGPGLLGAPGRLRLWRWKPCQGLKWPWKRWSGLRTHTPVPRDTPVLVRESIEEYRQILKAWRPLSFAAYKVGKEIEDRSWACCPSDVAQRRLRCRAGVAPRRLKLLTVCRGYSDAVRGDQVARGWPVALARGNTAKLILKTALSDSLFLGFCMTRQDWSEDIPARHYVGTEFVA